MPRYFTKRPRADDEYWEPMSPLLTSIEVCDHEATDTGLLDADGSSIFRAPNPIGFGRDEDW